MKIKYVALALVFILVLLLTACAPKEGIVNNKAYHPGYWYTTTYCAVYGKNGACTMWMPHQQYSPPSWQLDLYKGDDHGWRGVSEAQFNSVRIGDYYRG